MGVGQKRWKCNCQLKILKYGNCHPNARYEKEPYVVIFVAFPPCLHASILTLSPLLHLQPKEFWRTVLIMPFSYIKSFTSSLFLQGEIQISWHGLWGPFWLGHCLLELHLFIPPPKFFPLIFHLILNLVSYDFQSFPVLVSLSGVPFHSLNNFTPSLEAN